jgi:signal transduction histidine kinase
MAVLTVRDGGIGIPVADLPFIVEFRRRATNVGPIAGSGLGLAGARLIVEQHGGSITAESEEGARRSGLPVPRAGAADRGG